jgi:hypothetical protein
MSLFRRDPRLVRSSVGFILRTEALGGRLADRGLPLPGEVRISLLQHLGAICEAVVKPRAEVRAGDVIGRSERLSRAGACQHCGHGPAPHGRDVAQRPPRAGHPDQGGGRAGVAGQFASGGHLRRPLAVGPSGSLRPAGDRPGGSRRRLGGFGRRRVSDSCQAGPQREVSRSTP